MILSGKILSEKLLTQMRKDIALLSKKGIVPKIAIIALGHEEEWKKYVEQKIKMADKLGLEKEIIHLKSVTEVNLLKEIKKLNKDVGIHGIIVQRPLPQDINREKIKNAVLPSKDIDGFRSNSNFKSPIWLAILKILAEVQGQEDPDTEFNSWMRKKIWVVIGKGETGGGPTISELQKKGITPITIDSKTPDKNSLILKGDIVICGVGGKRVVNAQNLKKGAILIGIGLRRGEDGKLHGDYDEDEIKDRASWYTPTPGGVGPLNVAFLFSNLIQAATNSPMDR